MSCRIRRAMCLALISFVLTLGVSGVASANGSAFFKPAASGEKVDLVYFGKIKGSRGQNLDFVECEISDGVLEVRWENDRPGHYRSPDIGKFMKEYGQPVDPKSLLITCSADGHEIVSERVPNKVKGIHQVDFLLPSIPGKVSFTDVFADSASAAPAKVEREEQKEEEREEAQEPAGHSGLMWLVPGLLALAAIGAAVRK